MAYLCPFIVRQWLSIARWNADSLNEQAVSLVKKGTISLLICWWHTCFISPQTTETSQNSLVPSWPAASSIYMKINHDSSIWPLLPGGGFGYVFSCVRKPWWNIWLCLDVCQSIEHSREIQCFCYSALNSSELVVSAKDLPVDVLTAISGTPSTLLSVLYLCTWWSWVIVYFLSMYL